MATTNAEGLRLLVENGLRAVAAAADKGSESAGKMENAAANAELKQFLTSGAQIATVWKRRAEAAQTSLGFADAKDQGLLANVAHVAQKAVGASDNHIVDAIYRTGQEIVARAEDARSRDLGIIATGQLALHYYIAAFGSLASYADALGDAQTATAMKQCGDEAKDQDERHTQLAKKILAT